jgi:hypothetical protein
VPGTNGREEAAGVPSRAVSDPGSPDFGPSGYLPDRAARRARKIVLRAPLGLQWVIGSLVVGVVLVTAGVLWLAGDDAPGAPWVEVGPVDLVLDAGAHEDLGVLLLGNGRIRAFADADELGVAYCAESRRLEAPDGRVWTLTGRGLGGADSLEEHPTLVRDGVLYLDPSRTTSAPPPSDDEVEPACAG